MTQQQNITHSETYQQLQRIGRGSFGEVYKGINTKTSAIVAIKVIDLEKAEDEIEDIQQEIQVLSQCNSPYITKYYGSYLIERKLWIIMEYLGGGSALDLMKAGPFSEQYISIILREVLKGIEYLHSEKKIHRDIKAANILLSENGDVKLADFGVAKQLTDSINKGSTFVGTPFWMSPEVIMQHAYDYSTDIWSLGITAIELAEGEPPHAKLHPMRALLQIPKSAPPMLSEKYSKFFREFVETCLQRSPEHRPTVQELRQFKFVSTMKPVGYLIDLIARHRAWQNQTNYQNKSDDESDSNERETKYATVCWDFNGDTVKLPSNGNHPPMKLPELSPSLSLVFDDLATRFHIPSSTDNGGVRNTSSGPDLFQNLRHIFQNSQLHYPGFLKDFTQAMQNHISKANQFPMSFDSSTNANSMPLANNSNQLVANTVKMRI